MKRLFHMRPLIKWLMLTKDEDHLRMIRAVYG